MLGAFRCLQKDSWRKLYYREPLKEKIRFTKVEDNREENPDLKDSVSQHSEDIQDALEVFREPRANQLS